MHPERRNTYVEIINRSRIKDRQNNPADEKGISTQNNVIYVYITFKKRNKKQYSAANL